jgi:hypothetical protein
MTEMKTTCCTRRISRAYNALSESISGGTHGMNSLTPRTRRNSRAYDALTDFGNRMVRYSHWIRASNDLLTSIFELNRPTFEWRKVCSPKYENHKKSNSTNTNEEENLLVVVTFALRRSISERRRSTISAASRD